MLDVLDEPLVELSMRGFLRGRERADEANERLDVPCDGLLVRALGLARLDVPCDGLLLRALGLARLPSLGVVGGVSIGAGNSLVGGLKEGKSMGRIK